MTFIGEIMVQDKSLLRSRTFWFSLITGILIALIPMFPVLEPIKNWIVNNSVLVAGFWTVLATILRVFTKDGVKLID